MGIPLRIVGRPPPGELEPGLMWRYTPGDEGGRECWWIVLPNTKPQGPGYCSEVSWRTTDRASSPPHEMWQVSGTVPGLTVSPSIDVECWVDRDGQSVREGSYWHGWIRDGMLVDALAVTGRPRLQDPDRSFKVSRVLPFLRDGRLRLGDPVPCRLRFRLGAGHFSFGRRYQLREGQAGMAGEEFPDRGSPGGLRPRVVKACLRAVDIGRP